MKVFGSVVDQELVDRLKSGAVGVLRTDTLYGIVAAAGNEAAVERVYELKGRDGNKSPIVLVHGQTDLFDTPTNATEDYLSEVWPGPVSVILPSSNAPDWITRGNGSVAYRLPADQSLHWLLERTGPLIAPSANPQGDPPATSLDQALGYFGYGVDFYVDGGTVQNMSPSRLMRLHNNGTAERLR